jgi:hypothetical protein
VDYTADLVQFKIQIQISGSFLFPGLRRLLGCEIAIKPFIAEPDWEMKRDMIGLVGSVACKMRCICN